MEAAHDAVERAITAMWQRYGESLSLEDLADSALLSKYYFSRLFHEVTGLPPFRFLTAVRLYEAKRLLRETALSVTNVTYLVGYNSIGTFTTRFTQSVGKCPTQYRSMVRAGLPVVHDPDDPVETMRRPCIVQGTICVPRTQDPLRVYVGAFGSPIMEGRPIGWDVLEESGSYRLTVPTEGLCYVRAAAVIRDRCPSEGAQPPRRQPVFVGERLPVVARPGDCVTLDVPLRRSTFRDAPIVMALPELDARPPNGHVLEAADRRELRCL